MAQSIDARFGPGSTRTTHAVEWSSDNAPPYTAHETRDFGRGSGLLVCTTPSYSPESNGMAEAFVKTFKRDYVYLAELHSADEVLRAMALGSTTTTSTIPIADWECAHPYSSALTLLDRKYST